MIGPVVLVPITALRAEEHTPPQQSVKLLSDWSQLLLFSWRTDMLTTVPVG